MTKPFDYMYLNRKLTRYALKGCIDQLRRVHGVSVIQLFKSERHGVYTVTAACTTGTAEPTSARARSAE